MSTNTTAGQAKRQKTGEESFTSAEDDRNNTSPPIEEDISSVLCKIVDTENYTTDEVEKALDNFFTWLLFSDNNRDEQARISKEFMELGGIPHILKFFKKNKDNVGYMLRASKVISILLYPGSNDIHLENSSTMTQTFVERKGVEMMLSIISEKYTGELDTDQLDTLKNIFYLFAHTMWNMNKKNTVEIDTFLPIIDAGISTMAILSNISTHDVAVASVKRKIFTFMNYFVVYNAEMIDVVDFHEKNIFSEYVRALKNAVDNTWNYDREVWGRASKFFYQCCKENRKILSRESDFEVIVPFCIQFIKEDPNHAFTCWTFELLRNASDILGKKKMMTSNKGILGVLSTVAEFGNDTVSIDLKDEAKTLMRYLLDDY